MRASSVAVWAVALLASDASAWRSRRPSSWRWRYPSTELETTIVRTVVVPEATAAPAAPTTLVKVTTTAAPAAATTPAATTPAATTPAASSSNLGTDQQNALNSHNAARSEVGTPALVWDDALAQAAQEWADHLTTVGTLTHASGTGQGENLYMQSGRGSTPFLSASDMWIAEKADYSGQKIGEGNFASYGHYTQVVWKSTTKVGMASATDSSGRTYVVARYSPPGNFIGQTPF